MSPITYFRSVSTKIVLVPVVAFVLGLLIPGILAYQLLKHDAERDSHEKALTTLQLLSAVRSCSDDVDRSDDGPRGGTAAHRGDTATQEVMRRYDAGLHENTYRYRRVALNATDPHNRPDKYESELIRAFASNNRLSQAEEHIDRDGTGFHALAVPITVSQDRCLQCHGLTSVAPPWRLKRYGRTAGFGWKRGQVVGLDIVYTPSDFATSRSAAAFWKVAKSVGVLTLLCAVLLFLRSYYLVTRPVARMLATSEAIRQGEWRQWPGGPLPDELAMLSESFQTTTMHLRSKIIQEEKLRALFQQFIPASVAATALGRNAAEVLAGTRHSVTVMVINIRNFRLLMDHLPPDQTVATLNEYFSAVNKIIVANKGLVSKYMGDSVVALFGMPVSGENHALHAVTAALSIPAALQDLYVRLDEKFGWELGVGIGISTGEPIIGSFGSSEHLEYTVLGEVVGEASNLENATKSVPEEDSILISEATYRCVMSDVHVFDLGEKPTGNDRTLHAYVVQGLRTEVRASIAA